MGYSHQDLHTWRCDCCGTIIEERKHPNPPFEWRVQEYIPIDCQFSSMAKRYEDKVVRLPTIMFCKTCKDTVEAGAVFLAKMRNKEGYA